MSLLETRSRAGRHDRASPGEECRARSARRARGFSLIELLVALSVAAIVLTSAMTAVTYASKSATRGRAERDLVREAEFFSVIIQRSLERAGLGVPGDLHLDDGAPNPITAVVFSEPTVVGVVGDFPRPHAQYPTLGYLHGRAGGSQSRLSYHTENNGTCVQGTCSVADASIFFPGDTATCSGAGDFGSRTCPWGLRRLAAGDQIQIYVGTGGAWTNGRVHITPASMINVTGGIAWLRLNTDYTDAADVWPNTSGTGELPAETAGHAFLTTLDRVFFQYDPTNRRLERRQCWGTPETDAAFWPPATATTLPSPMDDVVNFRFCTPWEIILTNVNSAAFSYFDELGVATAVKADMRRIDYTIEVARDIAGQTVRYVVTGTAAVSRGVN